VRDVIGEIGARDIPEIVVFNKVDLLQDDDQRLLLRALEPTAIFVSARTGEGVADLQARVAELVPSPSVQVDLLVPYDRGDVVASLHDRGRILSTEYVESGTRVSAMINEIDHAALRAFEVVPA
jgi:GTP-binding protein HflX